MTGLTPHVIRVWEQRYRAVEPARTEGNRRLYSDGDVERLRMLRDGAKQGHSIGQLARMGDDELREAIGGVVGMAGGAATLADDWVGGCLAAVEALDGVALEDVLKRGVVALGAMGVLKRVVAPLVRELGDKWRGGELTAAHEHFATGVVRGFLAGMLRPCGPLVDAPVLVAATPTGQVHELGVWMVGAAAANLGWQVVQLGASLPAAEIAGAAVRRGARVVALSLVYPEDDPRLGAELRMLRELLPADVVLVVGGRAVRAYRGVLLETGATVVEDLDELGVVLDVVRRPLGKESR